MKFAQADRGRSFVIRLEDGEIVHEEIERFAREQHISRAALIMLGGADKGSRLVVGPEHSRGNPVNPMEAVLADTHEITGTGTIFPNKQGLPVLHMHAACGRREATITGCVRKGVKVWHVMEVILFELVDNDSIRKFDEHTGFELLEP
jgi:predicted DNA-binding protein with PD1-like motif